MTRFGCGILAGVSAVAGGLAAVYFLVALVWPQNLPAPAISRLIHIDEKLRFIREHPQLDPRIIAVGSSITWRQLDGAAIEAVAGGPGTFFNGATAFLKIHQTRALTRFYLDHFDNVEAVLLLAGLPDFSDCSDEPAGLFDPQDASRYAFLNWPPLFFYFRYFSPQRYLTAAINLDERRIPFAGDLFLDAYSSGPLRIPVGPKSGLRYASFRTDPACLETLDKMADELASQGIALKVVIPPANPEYWRAYPEMQAAMGRIDAHLHARLRGRGAQVMSLYGDSRFASGEFVDAFHLQWPSAQRLTRLIADSLDYPTGRALTGRLDAPLLNRASAR